jgi:purine-binding chemotaxis protein CheW
MTTEDELPPPPELDARRGPSLTPRQLAAVLNEPRRTPAAGVVAIPAPPVSPAPAEPSLQDVLLFRLGSERFGAALATIDEAVDLPAVHSIPESPPSLIGVFELRDKLVSLYSAAAALHVPEMTESPSCAFILSVDGVRVGIAVEALDDAVALSPEVFRPVAAEAGGMTCFLVWRTSLMEW